MPNGCHRPHPLRHKAYTKNIRIVVAFQKAETIWMPKAESFVLQAVSAFSMPKIPLSREWMFWRDSEQLTGFKLRVEGLPAAVSSRALFEREKGRRDKRSFRTKIGRWFYGRYCCPSVLWKCCDCQNLQSARIPAKKLLAGGQNPSLLDTSPIFKQALSFVMRSGTTASKGIRPPRPGSLRPQAPGDYRISPEASLYIPPS